MVKYFLVREKHNGNFSVYAKELGRFSNYNEARNRIKRRLANNEYIMSEDEILHRYGINAYENLKCIVGKGCILNI